LGGKQRATDTGATGLTLMGVRLYSPIIGRFLSTDPVYGGNDNTYTYPADPVNSFDLDGRTTMPIEGVSEDVASSGCRAKWRFWLRLFRAFVTMIRLYNDNLNGLSPDQRAKYWDGKYQQKLKGLNRAGRNLRDCVGRAVVVRLVKQDGKGVVILEGIPDPTALLVVCRP
jgi:RHS repeat-associated protein